MLFSIIVPVYKAEKYVQTCIESILAQTYKDFQLVLVDDGSPDNSPQICDAYAEQDSRIAVIHKRNGGVVSARSAGINAAKGEYILFVDADDWIAKELLQELYEGICKYNSPDMILYDAYKVYSERKELLHQSLKPGYYDKEKLHSDVVPFMMYDRSLPFLTAMIGGYLWTKLFKRDIIKEHFCTDEVLYRWEDFACVYECIYFSKSFYYLNKPLYFYNKMNEASVMSVYDPNYFRNHSNVIMYITEHLGKYSDILQNQIDACNVSGICIGVFQEIRHGKKLFEARKHLKKELQQVSCLQNISYKNIPLHAKMYIFLLKRQMYLTVVMIAKLILFLESKKNNSIS